MSLSPREETASRNARFFKGGKLNQEKVQKCARMWADSIGLKDWRIEVRVLPKPDDNVLGRCQITVERKIAAISIYEWTPVQNDAIEEDLEETIVHELLHIHTQPIVHLKGDGKSLAEEQAVECLSVALVQLSRKQG